MQFQQKNGGPIDKVQFFMINLIDKQQVLDCYYIATYKKNSDYKITLHPDTETVSIDKYNETTQKYENYLPNLQSIEFNNVIGGVF
jgi:hypothetical protein